MRSTGFAVCPDASTLGVLSRLIESGDLRVHVDDIYDLADVADAHSRLEQSHTRGKLVLRVADE